MFALVLNLPPDWTNFGLNFGTYPHIDSPGDFLHVMKPPKTREQFWLDFVLVGPLFFLICCCFHLKKTWGRWFTIFWRVLHAFILVGSCHSAVRSYPKNGEMVVLVGKVSEIGGWNMMNCAFFVVQKTGTPGRWIPGTHGDAFRETMDINKPQQQRQRYKLLRSKNLSPKPRFKSFPP